MLYEDFNSNLCNSNTSKKIAQFVDESYSNSFIQCINLPTRITSHSKTIIENTNFAFKNERCTLMSNLNRISPQIPQTSLQLLTNTLLFGNSSYSDKTNTHILNATVDYI